MTTRIGAAGRFTLGLVHVGEHPHRAIIEDLASGVSCSLRVDRLTSRVLSRLSSRTPACLRPTASAGIHAPRGETAKIDDANKHLHFGSTVGIKARHDEFISQMNGIVAI